MSTDASLRPGLSKPPRRPDIDWVRALAVLLLVPFHASLVFGPSPGYHISTGEDYQPLMYFATLVHQWHMPLLFVLSGMSTWFALRFRRPGQYAWERVKRLLVPLVFGTLVIVPPQMYCQRLSEGRFEGSYWAFYPHFFDGAYPQGNFTYNHLWFVLYLLVFSIAALPLLVRLDRAAGRRMTAWLAGVCERRGGLFVFALPPAVTEAILRARYPGLQTLVGDWANFTWYLYLFVLGAVLCSQPGFWRAIVRDGRLALVCGLASTAAGIGLHVTGTNPDRGYSVGWMLYMVLCAFNAWFWMIVMLSAGKKYLNADNGLLRYVREASYPFYILHQTVLIGIGYHVMAWQTGVMTRYLTLVVTTIVVTTVVYDVAVRRTGVTRFLFGMRPKKRTPVEPALSGDVLTSPPGRA